jgi:hypothetical protein
VNDRAKNPSGANASPNTPDEPTLDLVSGFDDDPRQRLVSSHDLYWLFAFAWRWQDSWSIEAHRDFWEAALPLWPRNRGNRPNVQTLAWHVASLRAFGHEDKAISEALDYQLDTPRRQGVLDHADGLHHDALWGGPRRPPLPRVWSFAAGDDVPFQHGYVNVRSDRERWALRAHAEQRGEPAPSTPTHALDPDRPKKLVRPSVTDAAHKAAAHALERLKAEGRRRS